MNDIVDLVETSNNKNNNNNNLYLSSSHKSYNILCLIITVLFNDI